MNRECSHPYDTLLYIIHMKLLMIDIYIIGIN